MALNFFADIVPFLILSLKLKVEICSIYPVMIPLHSYIFVSSEFFVMGDGLMSGIAS